jgi:hypothetical protein
MQRLERDARPAMQLGARGRAEVAAERFLEQRVREPRFAERVGHAAQHADVDRRTERVEHRGQVHLGHLREDGQVERAAEHRPHLEEPARPLGQGIDPAVDHVAHALGQLEPLGPRRLAELPLALEQRDELADEVRVAVGRLVIACATAGATVMPPDASAYSVTSATPRPPSRRRWLVRASRRGCATPPRSDAPRSRGTFRRRAAARPDLARDEPEQQQRFAVRPVEIVERDHEQLVRRHRAQERRDRVEEQEARGLGIGARRHERRDVRTARAHGRHDARELEPAVADLGAQRSVGAVVTYGGAPASTPIRRGALPSRGSVPERPDRAGRSAWLSGAASWPMPGSPTTSTTRRCRRARRRRAQPGPHAPRHAHEGSIHRPAAPCGRDMSQAMPDRQLSSSRSCPDGRTRDGARKAGETAGFRLIGMRAYRREVRAVR